jgi:hypothetical protein
MGNTVCCVCDKGQEEVSDFLERVLPDAFACPVHSLEEVVRSRPFLDWVRRVTINYYRETLTYPTTVVWASNVTRKFRPAGPSSVVDVPNQVRVVVLPDDAWPSLVAVDDVLASVFRAMASREGSDRQRGVLEGGRG